MIHYLSICQLIVSFHTCNTVLGARRVPLQDVRQFGVPQQTAHIGRVADQPRSGLSHGGSTLGEIPSGVIKCGK